MKPVRGCVRTTATAPGRDHQSIQFFSAAARPVRYLDLNQAARVARLSEALADPTALAITGAIYSAETSSELGILRAARQAQLRLGTACVANVVVSRTQSLSDLLETALLLKEAELLRPGQSALDVNIVPLV